MVEQIEIDLDDAVMDAQVFTPDGQGPWTPVILFPDAGGVRASMEQLAARFAQAGHVVLLPDVFHRLGPTAPFDFKTVFQTPSEKERLMSRLRALDGKRLIEDVEELIAYLGTRGDVRGTRVGTVGYCMGGRHALLTAIAYPDQVAATAPIHAGGLVTDADDSPHKRVGSVAAQLYFGVADKDGSCTPEHQAELVKALASAKKSFVLEFYAGAEHGFAVADAPVFSKAAADRHYARVTRLFAEAL